jgi:glutamyl-tRNA synthetase
MLKNRRKNQKQKASIELAKTLLPQIKETLQVVEDWNNSNLFTVLVELSAKLEIKKQALLWIARIAITGFESTAGGATEIAEILGKQETLNRIDCSIAKLNA